MNTRITYSYPMPSEAEAIYTPAEGMPCNPLRDALPPRLERDKVIEYLKRLPAYSPSDRKGLTADEKYDRLDRILQVFFPLSYYVDLQRAVYRAARNSYDHRNPLEPGFYQRVIAAADSEKKFRLPTGISQADCLGFAISGDSGIGKSHTILYTLQLFPRVITHSTLPDGKPFPFRQVTWLIINCPRNGSVRALCVEILKAYDAVLGSTNYEVLYDRKDVSADKMVSHIERIACFHGTAIIVIDEVQNLALAPSGGADQTLAFFSNLMHKIGLPIILVGTVAAVGLLSSRFSQARRATGYCNPVWHRLERDDPDWTILLNAIWRYQYTIVETKIDDKINEMMHRCTQGIADNVAKLYRAVQEKLIYRIDKDKQIITPEFIKKTAAKLFELQRTHLDLISGDKPAQVEPDSRRGNCQKQDYLLPEELAKAKEEQKRNGNANTSANGKTTAANSADKKAATDCAGQEKTQQPRQDKAGQDQNPVLAAAEAARAAGKSVAAELAKAGFAVTTSELTQGSK